MTDTMVLTGTESITIPANDETSRAPGSRFGGVQGFWIAEADQITSSTPKLRNIKLEPQQLAVLVFVTDKLLKNASALSQYVNRAATDEINCLLGDAIIDGTGSGQPLGVLQSGALVSVAKESGQSAKTVVTDNIHKMWARLHPRARLSAVWFINICHPAAKISPGRHCLKVKTGTNICAGIILPQTSRLMKFSIWASPK
ncbi:MAG: phage major capsid protein [Proteobacteria bacterium]|nr:phage major capsid protein [Pseudomonadota bacterium]